MNGNRTAQLTELLQPTGFVSNINPADPGAVFSPNQVDPELSAPTVQSIVSGVEHELRANFLVGVTAGYGRATNRLWRPFIGLTSTDFVEYRTVGDAGGVTSTTPVYRLASGSSLPPGSGVRVSNRDGYHQRYWNLDLTATRRLANRWMFRGFLTLQQHQEYFDDSSRSIQDPTPRVGAPTSGFVGAARPLGQAVRLSTSGQVSSGSAQCRRAQTVRSSSVSARVMTPS